MNRLQKKCLIASTGFHLLLGLILLVGPAFLSSKTKPEDVPLIEILPDITTDANASGGGPKGVSAPRAQPVPPAALSAPVSPTRVPVEEKKPERPPVIKEKNKEVAPPEDAKTSRHKIEVSTTPMVRSADAQAAAKARAAEAKARADERRRSQVAFNRALSNLSENMSSGTEIKLGSGNGTGGVSYGNWLSAVKKTYTDAWVVPDGVTDDSATVLASVTIARNGEVLSTSIVKSSGNPLVDHSVKATLDRVTNAPRLPEGAKEDQRTVTINFNVKAKQGLG